MTKTSAINKKFLFDGLPLYIEDIDVTPGLEEIRIIVQVKGDKRLDLRYLTPKDKDAGIELKEVLRKEVNELKDWFEENLPR